MTVSDITMVHVNVVRLHIEGTPLDWEYVLWVEEHHADTAVPRT